MNPTNVDSETFQMAVASFLDNGEIFEFPPENLRKITVGAKEIEIQAGDATLIGDTLITSSGTKLQIPGASKAIQEKKNKKIEEDDRTH